MPLEGLLEQYNRDHNTNLHFSELLSSNDVNGMPLEPGVYVWYFQNIPNVPVESCERNDGFVLLYIGMTGNSNRLRGRIRGHYSGNAENSTLRQSLGCLLSEELNIELRYYRRSKRFSYQDTVEGEEILSQWMQENARVLFCVCADNAEAHQLESWLICHKNLSLPLNLQGNREHEFYQTLRRIRRDHLARARELENLIVPTNQCR